MSLSTLKIVYFSLFHLHIQYSLLNWGRASKTILCKLKILQNKILRAMLFCSKQDQTNSLYFKPEILKIEDMIAMNMQNLCSNLTIIWYQTLSIAISQSSKMYTNTTLSKNSAMNIFNFVFPLNREEKLYIISVYKCGRMSQCNFATVHFQRLKNFSNLILSNYYTNK